MKSEPTKTNSRRLIYFASGAGAAMVTCCLGSCVAALILNYLHVFGDPEKTIVGLWLVEDKRKDFDNWYIEFREDGTARDTGRPERNNGKWKTLRKQGRTIDVEVTYHVNGRDVIVTHRLNFRTRNSMYDPAEKLEFKRQ